MAAHNELGKEGERLAANHLQSEGYVIRHRNWRCGHKEIGHRGRKKTAHWSSWK